MFQSHTREIVDDVLIIRYIDLVGMDCLQLAVECKCRKFISSSIVQSCLNDIWKGTRKNTDEMV